MTDGDGAAVDVDPVGSQTQGAGTGQGLGGEGLVQFDKIYVVGAKAQPSEQGLTGINGTGAHVRGVNAHGARSPYARKRFGKARPGHAVG